MIHRSRAVRKGIAEIDAREQEDEHLETAGLKGLGDDPTLPATLQFVIAMIACAINERMRADLGWAYSKIRDALRTAEEGTR